MGDIRGDRVERHRDEGVYVPPVEKDRKEKEKFRHTPPREEEKILSATFFFYLKKIFNTLSTSKKLAGKVVDQQLFVEHLEIFKNLLKKLMKEDLSKSSEYALQLSENWSHLLEDFDGLEIIERKNLKKVALFRELLDIVKHYPPESEHSFGYYLLNQAGKNWLPFPFIEILETLHSEHKEKEKESTLTAWCSLIDSVIENLKNDLPFKGIPR
ncbi:MAG: hypothetical protein KR126chlam1_00991 [Chlamydiae bacterium]|nr:hypothetical protein [Chlamydiota bacterium]